MVVGVLNSEKYGKILNLPVFNELQEEYCISFEGNVSLVSKNKPEIIINFATKQNKYLIKNYKNQSFPLIKACGITKGKNIIDATAGFAKDAFLLACFGCNVHMIENSKIVYLLLKDALERGVEDTDLKPILSRMKLYNDESANLIPELCKQEKIDIIYFDPMFDSKTKAKPKKNIQILQSISSNTNNALVLNTALKYCKKVIVKRGKKDEYLAGIKPSWKKDCSSNRFDIYLKY